MKILLDSCIWGGAKNPLQSAGHDVVWVGDFLKDPGDEAIMQFSISAERIIVTQDKDFGELAIFRGVPHFGIIQCDCLGKSL
jgi:predicted nuclease of predicted toxin-antitoxin system